MKEIAVPKYVEVARPSAAKAKSLLFAHFDDDRLLGYGVPPGWLADAKIATEDSLLELADHLPAEAAETPLELATGGTPVGLMALPAGIDPFEHPDAQRRFRTMHDGQELQRALDHPWEKWTVFLHPAQEQLVRMAFNGPARVAGQLALGGRALLGRLLFRRFLPRRHASLQMVAQGNARHGGWFCGDRGRLPPLSVSS